MTTNITIDKIITSTELEKLYDAIEQETGLNVRGTNKGHIWSFLNGLALEFKNLKLTLFNLDIEKTPSGGFSIVLKNQNAILRKDIFLSAGVREC